MIGLEMLLICLIIGMCTVGACAIIGLLVIMAVESETARARNTRMDNIIHVTCKYNK